jgi:phage gpG-like protein
MTSPLRSREVHVEINTRRLNQILRDLPGNAHNAVATIAREIEGKAKISIGEEKHGAIYLVQGGIEHQASAPGEAPAIDTGNLVNSIQVEMTGPAAAVVFTNVEYAPYLEFGTIEIAPRPFLQPAVDAITEAVAQDPRRYFREVVEG